MSTETGDTTYRTSFVTGESIAVRLYAVLDNNQLAPLITEWDKLDIEVIIKSKKNKSIGMGTSRTQTSIEGFRLTLSRAKKDALVDTEILLNQAHMMAYLPNREYVVRLEVNHSYSASSMKAPEEKGFGNMLNKAVGNFLSPQNLSKAGKTLVALGVNNAKNFAVNKISSEVNKLRKSADIQRDKRKSTINIMSNANIATKQEVNKIIKPLSKKIQGTINKGIDALAGLSKFGIDTPDVFQEIYDFQYCSITAGSLNFEPKEISKHNITLEASFCECTTKTNSMSQYQYNKSIESTLAKFKKENQTEFLLSNEARDARLSQIQTNVIIDSLTTENSHIITEPPELHSADTDKRIQEVYSSR